MTSVKALTKRFQRHFQGCWTLAPVVLKNCTVSDTPVHQPVSKSIFLHTFPTGYMKSEGLVSRLERNVLHGYSLRLKSVSHHPAVTTGQLCQPHKGSSLNRDGWHGGCQLVQELFPTDSQHKWLLLLREDEPCMTEADARKAFSWGGSFILHRYITVPSSQVFFQNVAVKKYSAAKQTMDYAQRDQSHSKCVSSWYNHSGTSAPTSQKP